MNELLRPYLLRRIAIEKPWAGEGLRTLFPFGAHLAPSTGETVEAADIEGLVTPLVGTDLTLNSLMAEIGQKAMLGYALPHEPHFPIMLKFLDTAEALSVQCHPHDVFSEDRETRLSFGKEEAWLVLRAEEGAAILQGVCEDCRDGFWELVTEPSRLTEILEHRLVINNDFLLSPSGIVHSIGAGLTVLEIQQATNTTWRIADFPNAEGKTRGRELHLKEAIRDARLDLDAPAIKRVKASTNPFWDSWEFRGSNFHVTSHKMMAEGNLRSDVPMGAFFTNLGPTILVEGGGHRVQVPQGDTCFVPAATHEPVVIALENSWFVETNPVSPSHPVDDPYTDIE